MDKKTTPKWKIEFLRICQILKDNEIDISKIPTRKTTADGKRKPITLKDISEFEIDIMKIIKENNLDEDYPIGHFIRIYRDGYNGTRGSLTEEERERGELLGIVKKRDENVSAPIFKGGKISQFHLDFISNILDRIIKGQLNLSEALELLRQYSLENNETVLNGEDSIKRCVEMLLRDRPEELKTFYETLKENRRNKRPNIGNIGKPQVGMYSEKREKFEKKIIEDYLPLILSGQITIAAIETELSCSHKTINKIIENYYKKNNDSKGLEEYNQAKKQNDTHNFSSEEREKARQKRKETAKERRSKVANYQIVGNNEFVLLSAEEQMIQLVMKIQISELKEQKSEKKQLSSLCSEDTVKKHIARIMSFFRSKNDIPSNKIYFADDEIRYMIYRFPSIVGISEETLNKKIDTLTSFEDIDIETAYGVIKIWPAIMGYDQLRTKKQLDLLEKEDLIDAVISNPRRFMFSINLMYALIQFAKERHHTSDLKDINRNNIFLANRTLKRLYSTSAEELKARFPYSENPEPNLGGTISSEEIGQATFDAGQEKISKADNVLNQVIKDSERGTQV